MHRDYLLHQLLVNTILTVVVQDHVWTHSVGGDLIHQLLPKTLIVLYGDVGVSLRASDARGGRETHRNHERAGVARRQILTAVAREMLIARYTL